MIFLKKKATPEPVSAPPRSLEARYLGVLFFVLQNAMQWSRAQAQSAVGFTQYPTITGLALPARARMRGITLPAFRAHIPDLYERPGFGNVLEAYVAGLPVRELMDPALVAILNKPVVPPSETSLKRDFEKQAREAAIIQYFGIDKYNYKTAPRPKARPEPADDYFPDEEACPNPLIPETLEEAVAQEVILRTRANLEKWHDLNRTQRLTRLGNQIQSMQEAGESPQDLWVACAAHLLRHLAPEAYRKAQEANDPKAIHNAMESMVKTMPDGPDETRLSRRCRLLQRFSPYRHG